MSWPCGVCGTDVRTWTSECPVCKQQRGSRRRKLRGPWPLSAFMLAVIAILALLVIAQQIFRQIDGPNGSLIKVGP